MVVLAGQDQTGIVGSELPTALSVRATDDAGRPLSGHVINFRVIRGGGHVATGVAISDAVGVARERWTLGTIAVDTQRVEVRWIDPVSGDGITYVAFNAVGVSDIPASIQKVTGDLQVIVAGSAAADSLAVRVKDRYGNAVADATVTWSADSGAGSVSPATTQTDTSGVARTQWTGGTRVEGRWSVTAMVGTLSVRFGAVAAPGAGTHLVLTQAAAGARAAAPFAVQPHLRVMDQFENVASVTGTELVMTASAGATPVGVSHIGSVGAGVFVFDNAGITGLVGTYDLTYTATVAGRVLTATQRIDLSAGPPHHYVVTADPDSLSVGGQALVTAALYDTAGNPLAIAGRSVSWSVAGAGGTFTSPTTKTGPAGTTSSTLRLQTTFTADSARITASDDAASGSSRISVSTGPADRVTFTTQPANVPYGVRYSVAAEIQDGYGNRIRGDTRTVWLILDSRPAGGTMAGTTRVDAVDGTASFSDLRFDVPGNGYRLVAVAHGPVAGLKSGETALFSVAEEGVVFTSAGITGLAVRDSMIYTPAGVVSVNGGSPVRSPSWGTGVVQRFATIALDGVYTYIEKFIAQREPSTHYGASAVSVDAATGARTEYPVYECIPGPDLEADGRNRFIGCDVVIGLPHIWRLGPGGGPLLNGNGPFALTGDQVYYLGPWGEIVRIPASGGTATSLIAQAGTPPASGGARRLAVIGSTIYWSFALGGQPDGGIRSGPATGGVATTIVTGLSRSVHGFRGDGAWIYFIDGGVLKRFSVATPATVQTIIATEPVTEVALDQGSLYWVTDGVVKKRRKVP